MKKKITIIKEKIHDGNWTEYHEANGIPFSFNQESFYLNYSKGIPIRELANEIEKVKFDNVMKEIEAKYLQDFDSYKSQNGLSLFYVANTKRIAIYSYGEKQPGRYQLFIEAILEN